MTTIDSNPTSLDAAEQQRFVDEGYAVVRGLFETAEIERLRDEFMRIKTRGPIPGHFEPKPQIPGEPYDALREYPRIMFPDQVNPLARRYLLDPRLEAILRTLLGEEVLAAQSLLAEVLPRNDDAFFTHHDLTISRRTSSARSISSSVT